MPKRLLLVLTEFPPSFGGMQAHAVALCRWLNQRGYYIEVATYRLEEGPDRQSEFPFTVHRVLSRVAYEANLRKLARLTYEMRADLIYSSTVYYGQLAQRTRVPVFCRSAGNDVLRPWIAWPYRFASTILDLPWVEQQLYRRWKRWQWPERLESLLLEQRLQTMRHSAGSMAKIFANSDFTTHLLEQAHVPRDRVVTMPGGVDARFYARGNSSRGSLQLEQGQFNVLTACRLVAKKGLETLLEAVAILRRKQTPLRLWIAGEGRERPRIEQGIVDLDLKDAVILLGYLNQEQLRDYFHAADLFVLSSREVVDVRTGLRDAETMGRVLCEAAACGLPRVSTKSGGIPSVIEDGVDGLLAQPGDADDLASKMECVFKNRKLAQRLAAAALHKASLCFDWKVLFEAHESAIEELLELDR